MLSDSRAAIASNRVSDPMACQVAAPSVDRHNPCSVDTYAVPEGSMTIPVGWNGAENVKPWLLRTNERPPSVDRTRPEASAARASDPAKATEAKPVEASSSATCQVEPASSDRRMLACDALGDRLARTTLPSAATAKTG